jgi:long-chain acyl-CoA synthetase
VKRIIDILPHYKQKYNRPDVLVAKRQGQWIKTGIDEFIQIADELSYGLMHHGIKPDDKVAIISSNCPEWNFADFGITDRCSKCSCLSNHVGHRHRVYSQRRRC